MTQLQDVQGFYNPFEGKNPKYKCCVTCEHFGSVFSYRTLRTQMMCGVGEENCNEVFGKALPNGYIMRKQEK